MAGDALFLECLQVPNTEMRWFYLRPSPGTPAQLSDAESCHHSRCCWIASSHGLDDPPSKMARHTDTPNRASSNGAEDSNLDNKARQQREGSTPTERPAMDDTRRVVFLRLRRWCLIMACIACGIDALFRFVIVDRPPPTAALDYVPPPTKTITLAVDRQIGSILDLYSPLLGADSPLLGPHCTAAASCGVGEADSEVEGWVLGSLRSEAWTVCTLRSQCGLGPVVSFSDMCKGLLRWLWRAEEKHYEIADSLAGPHRDGLWVSKIGFSFLDFLAGLEAASAQPRITLRRATDGNMLAGPAPDGTATEILDTMTSRALRLLVAERGPWKSLNGVIRHDLLSLRGNCVQIVEALELLSQACIPGPAGGPPGGSKYPLALSAALGRASGFIPRVKHMISAVDDGVAALDAVDGGIMALRTILDIMTKGGWSSEEHIDGEHWTILFRLPPPWDISRSVGERLERMGAHASGTYEAEAPLGHLPVPEAS